MDVTILETKHPEIKDIEPTWERVRILVEEDEKKYTDKNFFIDLPNEDQENKKKREAPFKLGFINPAQQLISLKSDYVFGKKIKRETKNDILKTFMEEADYSGDSLEEFMKGQASPNLHAYGTLFAVIDKPRGDFANAQQEIEAGLPYLCILDPLQVLDWQYSIKGELDWFRYATKSMIPRGPEAAQQGASQEYITWTQTEYIRHDSEGNEKERFVHGFGVVPVVIQAEFVLNSKRTLGKSTFFGASRHLVMGNNHLSVANVEVFRYSSVLLMNRNDWDSAKRTRMKDSETNLPRLKDKATEGDILTVDDLKDQAPRYLEKSIEAIVKANSQAQWYFNQAYDSEAIGQEAMPLSSANEGSKGASVPASGVSKAYDFQDMNSTLRGHAKSLENAERAIMEIVCSILKIPNDYSVSYPDEFDVATLDRKLNLLKAMIDAQFPSVKGLAMAYKAITPELTSDESLQMEINSEIEGGTKIPAPTPAIGSPMPPVDPSQPK